jgi:hypothetical protein
MYNLATVDGVVVYAVWSIIVYSALGKCSVSIVFLGI